MSVDNIVRIVLAGGGVSLDASDFTTDGLVRIVGASKKKNSKVIIRNTNNMRVDSLVRIALTGNGNVIFEV